VEFWENMGHKDLKFAVSAAKQLDLYHYAINAMKLKNTLYFHVPKEPDLVTNRSSGCSGLN
jgi:hypothetical protein